MTVNGWTQIAIFVALVLVVVKPLGGFMARVFNGERTWLTPVLHPVERVLYTAGGVDEKSEQHWVTYTVAMLLFNLIGLLVLYALLRLQAVLPFNPQGQSAVAPDLAFNTAASFTTNTNWQNYGGESTMGYLVQMAGLTVHNFVSAATGIALGVALTRAFARRSARTLGNFWVDLTRCTLYVLLPICFVYALVLVWQGVPQTLGPSVDATTLEGAKQTIAVGPVASQEAIKMLGTNGGGFFNANSAHPFEDPAILLPAVPASFRKLDPRLMIANRAKVTADLYGFSRKLAGVIKLDDLLWAAAFQVASMLKVRVVILLPDAQGDGLTVQAGYPPEDALDEAELAAAKWTWQHDRSAGRGADTLPGGKWLFLPMRTGRGPLGVIGIDRDRPGPLLTPDERRLLDALMDQTAIAVERIRLAEDIDKARVLAETDRLRSALLTSISHDLRTPLAAILGAATSLRKLKSMLDETAQDELAATIQEEAERLNRFIANLLDMTRLESGAIAPKTETADVAEAVGSALERAGKLLAGHRIEVDLPADLPPLGLDVVLFEQVLFNLLDNAAKYAPAGSLIGIKGRRDRDRVLLQVVDEGPGVPGTDLEHIFDKFYRVRNLDQQRAGTGLGLAVCRGFVEAMGGTIRAGNRTDRSGAVFTISFPVPKDVSAQAAA